MLLDRIKRATQAYHEDLERNLDLTREDLGAEEYARTLERFYGFYAPWESLAAPVLDRNLPGFFAPRRKSAWIVQDLQFLGRAEALHSVPWTNGLPRFRALTETLGSMYVLEGSTL